jgi:acyl-CoA reductase-like NAD-dependent aldehyde dehydrogenase
MKSNGTSPSIPHPNREQALKRARLTDGFPNIVNGQRIDSLKSIKISDPVTGEELASVSETQKDGLDRAVEAAKAALPAWSRKTWNERRDLLRNAMEKLKAHTDELCTILTAENGRPYSMAQWEITWIFETYVPALLQMELPDSTWNEPGVGQITKRYVPLGVVAAISPWNLPFLLSFTKALPSLLAGNTVVLKPAVFTPLTVLRAADYIREMLPPGVLNVISGGDDLGPWMTSHPDFQKVSFTGSSETGCKVFASASTNQSPHQYMLRLRVERSKELLADSRLSVLDVGLEVGFCNQQHFATVFRNIVGLPPSMYRTQL